MESPLLGKNNTELKSLVEDLGLPSFTAKQLSQWIYGKRVKTLDECSNISNKNRELLKQNYTIGRHEAEKQAVSKDGTIKYLYSTKSGAIESVYIPDGDRATLCVSSQVGCKMHCSFCATGQMGFHGQLTTDEILNQILSTPRFDTLTNIVFMGMGEPMDNYDNVLRTLDVMTNPDYGLGWSPRRITVSTVGITPKVTQFLKESECHLAISLHNPFSAERAERMPVEKAYPIHDLIEQLTAFDFSHQRRLSFEYTLFDGWNDTTRHAAALVRLLKNLDCRVNLIRYHSIGDAKIKGSNQDRAVMFQDYLNNHGITATIRKSRGEDISAACGLLATQNKE